jgi:pimeloyl-ACP methyl ester carboxylesterase
VAPDDTMEEMTFGYGEAATLARLVWSPRYNIQLPRRLNRVTAPSLVLRAAHDRLVSDEIAIAYRHALPNSRDLVIPGTGHALIQEEPTLVAEAITRFVTEKHS